MHLFLLLEGWLSMSLRRPRRRQWRQTLYGQGLVCWRSWRPGEVRWTGPPMGWNRSLPSGLFSADCPLFSRSLPFSKSHVSLRSGNMAYVRPTKDALREDLEPLFDYSRVQPDFVCLDDDDDGDSSDGSLVFFLNEKPKNTHILKEGLEHVADTSRCQDKKEEDDDWLPLPPKATAKATNKKLEEDPTLKELRLMKQELQSFSESAKDLLQAAEDSAGETVRDSSQSATVESLKTSSDRLKVIISIQDKDGLKQFRVYADDKFERIFRLYTNKVNVPSEMLTFCFDGDKIISSATPESLGMEDNDIIEVHSKSG